MSACEATFYKAEAYDYRAPNSYLSIGVVKVACDVSLPPMFARKENGLES
jgi:hypothetical protein